MPRFSSSVLVLAVALLGIAADSPQADVGPAARQSPALAEMAAKQWTAQFNPRALTVEDFVGLYRAAL